ncbi:AAA family ATPase, partial [uncultured Clostridium sp.]|uniref:AAA family ATPase n=1 Tax=uncultured Clostridium sp. TaxID=59620 RepID=UPI0026F45293
KNTISTELKIKDKTDINRFEVCKSDILNNNKIFFLTEMTRRIQMNDTKTSSFIDFINVFDFFINDLQLVLPNQNRQIKFNYFSQFKKDIKPLLKMLGLDIDDLLECESNMLEIKDRLSSPEYNKLTSDINQLRNNVSKFDITLRIENCIYTINGNNKDENLDVKVIKLVHNNSSAYFDTYEESDGTLRILELIDILLSDNKVFIIDEIDRSLHPSLTVRFVNAFLKLLKDRNIQLIITTHESRLLSYNVLRRDEVWFSEKKKDGSTKLYSLEQFKDDARFDRKIDKAYLDGRYGAVPIFIDFPGVDNESTDK